MPRPRPDTVKASVHSAREVSLKETEGQTTTPRTKQVASWNPISLPPALSGGVLPGIKLYPHNAWNQHVQALSGERAPKSAGLRKRAFE